MTLAIASQAHPDTSGWDGIMDKEQRFGKPPGKHSAQDDKLLIDECVTGWRRGTVEVWREMKAVWRGQTRGAGGGVLRAKLEHGTPLCSLSFYL